MKQIKYIILTLGIIAGFGLATLPITVSAVDIIDCSGDNAGTVICDNQDDTIQNYIKIIVDGLLFILGAVSVIMIIIAGIGYTTSGGDATSVTKAKNTLMYAVVGLVVALLAYAIVDFVLSKF